MIDGIVLRFVKHQINNFLFPVVAGCWIFILQKEAGYFISPLFVFKGQTSRPRLLMLL